MNKYILTPALLLLGATALQAQSSGAQKVVNRFGQLVDTPVFGSEEANSIQPSHQSCMAGVTAPATRAGAYYFVPHTGNITIPVLLIQFADVKFSVDSTRQAFEQLFNGTEQKAMGNNNQFNHGSVAQYFRDMSGGKFNINFKLFGPVTLDSKESVYGGSNADNADDEDKPRMIREAIAKLQASAEKVTDPTPFCSDGSTVDCVYAIYAGKGQNYGGDSTTVWAATGNLVTDFAGKNTRWYSVASELAPFIVDATSKKPMITGVGVPCHEFSHALGLPDFYPYTNIEAQHHNQQMQYWDLMDGGEYSYNGFCPTAYTAWEKQHFGWPVTLEELSASQQVTMNHPTTEGGKAYKLVNPDRATDYIVLENIHRSGWNSHLYSEGLMVYHVDETAINGLNRTNNTVGYPSMAIIAADGQCGSSMLLGKNDYFNDLRGDLFPVSNTITSKSVTFLTDDGNLPNKHFPNFNFYTKSGNGYSGYKAINMALTGITWNDGSITFNFNGDVATGIAATPTASQPCHNRIYTLQGRYAGTSLDALPKGVYLRNGQKIVKH